MKRKHKSTASRRPGTSYKMLAFAGVAGVAAVVGATYLQTKVAFAQQHWYVAPAGLAVAGLFLARKMPTIGVALAASAGLLAYVGYKSQQPTSTTTQSAGRVTDAGWNQGRRMSVRGDSGIFDSGALYGQRGSAQRMIAAQAGALMGAEARLAEGAGALYGTPIEGG